MNRTKQRQFIAGLLGISLFFILPINGFSQKLKADGYKITILKDPVKKRMNMHGKIYVTYKGKIKVNSKDSLKGIYTFSYMDLGNDIANIKFKNLENNKVLPKLIFYAKTGIFSFNQRNGEEGTLTKEMYLPLEDAVMQAMLISLKIIQKLPIE